MHLFDNQQPFWKGNLHCHTTLSDGQLSPEEVKKLYLSMGYDFLSITDHRLLSEQAHMMDNMLLIPGMEMDFTLAHEVLHLVGIGMNESLSDFDLTAHPQSCINLMRRCGGRVIVAHPAWSLNTMATLTALCDVTAAEIYNSVSTTPWNGDRADSSGILDVVATHGKLFNFVASDDSHFYAGEAGRCATMVQCAALTQENILSSMDAGRFYCTQGPRFEQIDVENNTITVHCSPVDTIVFYSNMVWSNGRCKNGKDLTEASYVINKKHDTFVRIQLIDAQGNSAWSNPCFLI